MKNLKEMPKEEKDLLKEWNESEEKEMTRKEKEKKVLEDLDLRVGDIIIEKNWKETYKIIEEEDRYVLDSVIGDNLLPVIYLIIYDFEVIQYHQKTYGEYKCGEIKGCSKCPLNYLSCCIPYDDQLTLFECLDLSIKNHNSEIYKAFHNELDKIVEDENKILN